MLSSLLATSRLGEIDFDRLVQWLSCGEPLQELPRQPRPTLRRGVQVLIEVGESMTPFARDQAELVKDLQIVVGQERMNVLHFVGCPARGAGPPGDLLELPYVPPPAGTPVLVVGQLGVFRPPFWSEWADPAEWAAFAARVRHAGCPAIALVPMDLSRVPAVLRRAFKLVSWDRRSSISTVRRAVGRAHRVL